MQQQCKTLWNRRMIRVSKSFQSHSFSHPRSLPPYSQAPSSPRRSSRILCEVGPRVPDAKSSPQLLGSSSVASYKFLSRSFAIFRNQWLLWCDLFASKSHLHHALRAQGQVAAQCLFSPSFQVPQLPVCLPAGRGGGLPTGCAATLLSSFYYPSTVFSPRSHLHGGFISTHAFC